VVEPSQLLCGTAATAWHANLCRQQQLHWVCRALEQTTRRAQHVSQAPALVHQHTQRTNDTTRTARALASAATALGVQGTGTNDPACASQAPALAAELALFRNRVWHANGAAARGCQAHSQAHSHGAPPETRWTTLHTAPLLHISRQQGNGTRKPQVPLYCEQPWVNFLVSSRCMWAAAGAWLLQVLAGRLSAFEQHRHRHTPESTQHLCHD